MRFGSPTWTRTRDLRINSPSLYQLSYQGIALRFCVN
jgi:hydroxymethylpyrimidine/phosphomethylpyrimidine kinase